MSALVVGHKQHQLKHRTFRHSFNRGNYFQRYVIRGIFLDCTSFLRGNMQRQGHFNQYKPSFVVQMASRATRSIQRYLCGHRTTHRTMRRKTRQERKHAEMKLEGHTAQT